MKLTFTTFLLAAFTLGANAQLLDFPEDFEAPEADTSWEVFGNGANDPNDFYLADNPVFNGINESDYCMEYTVQDNAETWTGAWTDHYGPITVKDNRYMFEMMVMKDVLTKCALKLENEVDGGDNVEVYVANTVTDEWELLLFDMSAAIDQTFTRLVFFPDFPDSRESGSKCYIDNINFPFPVSANTQKLEGIRIYPNPVAERMTIRYPGMESAVISNALGQTVRSFEFLKSSLEHLEISGLQPGLYFVTVETADEKVCSKFIKE